MWECRAEFEDGTSIEQNIIEDDDSETRRHELESYLIMYKKGCIWYSVNWVNEN